MLGPMLLTKSLTAQCTLRKKSPMTEMMRHRLKEPRLGAMQMPCELYGSTYIHHMLIVPYCPTPQPSSCSTVLIIAETITAGMAGWEKDQLSQFWHERFTVPCPASLIELLMPWFSSFKAAIVQAEQAGEKVYPSAYGLQKLLPYLCWAVVQDALELCSGDRPTAFKNNPVHQLLMTSSLFK